MRRTHKFASTFLLLFSIIIMGTGINNFTETTHYLRGFSWIMPVLIIVSFSIYMVFELNFRNVRQQEDKPPNLSDF
jgi:cytochrome b involved in lipid metabolism